MSTSIFKCKQFEISQTDAVFKITNDTTLIGAWAELNPAGRALEVGCGSGMISLMLAQRYKKLNIDAIDINTDAVALANANFQLSNWSDRLRARHSDLSTYTSADKSYTDIISNPPYHNSSHLPSDSLQAISRHDDSLPFETMIKKSDELLINGGAIHLIIPSDRDRDLTTIAGQYGYGIARWCHMHPRQSRPAKRSLITLTKEGSLSEPSERLIMYDEDAHHADYINLLKEFLIIF